MSRSLRSRYCSIGLGGAKISRWQSIKSRSQATNMVLLPFTHGEWLTWPGWTALAIFVPCRIVGFCNKKLDRATTGCIAFGLDSRHSDCLQVRGIQRKEGFILALRTFLWLSYACWFQEEFSNRLVPRCTPSSRRTEALPDLVSKRLFGLVSDSAFILLDDLVAESPNHGSHHKFWRPKLRIL